MCGIVGAVAQRNVTPILMEGLRRLEYRGYDSAGLAVIDNKQKISRYRIAGKVSDLQLKIDNQSVSGTTGIAHTRWATHGKPTEANAHPHMAADQYALVHNGIIENYVELRQQLQQQGFKFESDTDTEVVVKQLEYFSKSSPDLLTALRKTLEVLEGSYAFAIMSAMEPDKILVARHGSPLVVGVGIEEHFIASDVLALLPVTRNFMFLEDGDIAEITCTQVCIRDKNNNPVNRKTVVSEVIHDVADKGNFRHYMLKEIFEQPSALHATIEPNITSDGMVDATAYGSGIENIFPQVKAVTIVACGTSHHAGLVAKYWCEELAGLPCQVEVASEYRYRKTVVIPGTLFVTISQSGETADTLAALQGAKQSGYLTTLAICNVAGSSLTRESDHVFMTRAGTEIGVASTKAFTTQLVGLLLLIVTLARYNGMPASDEKNIVSELQDLPGKINACLELNDYLDKLAAEFSHKHHTLYLGRGTMLPIAMEGALKLKEISYIHAEAYPAGELKHGPLALVDEDMPVIALVHDNKLLEKIKSNLQEVKARDGKLYLFTDANVTMEQDTDTKIIKLASINEIIAPILYTIPLQLLAYHIAVIKGADVDQPRNLAKSVTVE